MPTSIAVSLNSPSPPPAARLSASPPGSPRRELPAHNQSRSPPRVPALIVRHPSPSYSNGNGGNGYSYGNGSTGNGSSNGGASASPTAAGHTHARAPQLSFPPISSTSSNRRVAAVPLLIPTDRTIDDLEENWLPRLGKVRVEREVRLTGYSLYGIRSW
jgi:hypothetical protein